MAKHGIRGASASNILTGTTMGGWSLCIGAGASLPLFPTWQDMVQELLTSGPNALSSADADYLRQSFPPEALIRASQELLGADDAAYRSYLTEILYGKIEKQAARLWPTVAKCLMARVPGNALASEWNAFRNFILLHITTSSDLAAVILDGVGSDHAPNSILTFNAESLLFAALNAEAVNRFRLNNPMPTDSDSENGPGVIDRVEGSTSWSKRGRIPFYFCHGFLPINHPSGIPWTSSDSTFDSKMVFSESDYLNLANNVLSWQSSVFTRAAMSDRIVFVGLSLTDPNMRRWLAWIHGQRLKEIQARNPTVRESTQHIWLQRTSGNPSIERWTEALVAHLGIRIVWIDSWSEAGPTLRRMLNL
jgi:hypothetical protein